VIVCGGYESEGGTTTVSFFRASSGELTNTWSLPYQVNTMDAEGGYVAIGERNAPIVHLYRLSDGSEKVSYRVELFEDERNYIGNVLIDNGVVIACNTEQHCIIDFYNIVSGIHIQSDHIYQPVLAVDKSTHTLAAMTTGSTPAQMVFFDTQTGEQLARLFQVPSATKITWNGSTFETWNAHFSISGEIVSGPQGLAPTERGDAVVYDVIAQNPNYVFWTVAEKNPQTGAVLIRTMARSDEISLSASLAFYGDRLLELGIGSGRFLLWGENYCELLIVDLRS